MAWSKLDLVLSVLVAVIVGTMLWLLMVGQYSAAASCVGFLSAPAVILVTRRSPDGLRRRTEDQRRIERWGRAPK